MPRTLGEEIARQRMSDELAELMATNVAQLSSETYEENLARRAKLELRKEELLSHLYTW